MSYLLAALSFLQDLVGGFVVGSHALQNLPDHLEQGGSLSLWILCLLLTRAVICGRGCHNSSDLSYPFVKAFLEIV
jgi:hypothetical protein